MINLEKHEPEVMARGFLPVAVHVMAIGRSHVLWWKFFSL